MGELGMWLVRAREARGLTVEDAERDTRISRRYLQALESENFEVIPAPVYARGFLRSYSQYLGLDPAEMLALFPGEEENVPAPIIGDRNQTGNVGVGTPPGQPQKPTMKTPISGQSAARPQWNKPTRKEPPMPKRPARPATTPAPQVPDHGEYEIGGPVPPPAEPMIGVDIGVPVPARKLKADPAAQRRTLTVIGVAIAVILGVVALAIMISRAGDDGGASPGVTATSTESGAASIQTPSTPQGGPGTSGLAVTPGVVPEIVGVAQNIGQLALTEAGFSYRAVQDTRPCSQPGFITEAAPGAGASLAEGRQVIITVCPVP